MKIGDTVVLRDGSWGRLRWVWVSKEDNDNIKVLLDTGAKYSHGCRLEDIDWPATEAANAGKEMP